MTSASKDSGIDSVEEARYQDLSQLVNLHLEAFPGFFLTQLGTSFLKQYYRLILEQENGILLVSRRENTLVGFVSGFSDSASFYGALRRCKWRFLTPAIVGVLRRPSLMARTLYNIANVRQRSELTEQHRYDAELSSIAVAPEFAGQGIGKKLVLAFLKQCDSRRLCTVSLTTDAENNESVNLFYAKLGFRLTRRFLSGQNRQMNEYVIELNSDRGNQDY